MNSFYLVSFLTIFTYVRAGNNVSFLEPGQQINYNPRSLPQRERQKLQIYCYEGHQKNIIYIFHTMLLHLNLNTDSYDQYEGGTPDEVTKKYTELYSSWSLNFLTWKHKQIKLNPFNQSCIGIVADDSYSIHLQLIRVDYWKILFLFGGIMFFLSAPKLSNNALFYYLCGILLGVSASFLILVYLVSKLFPKRPLMYGFVLGGWTVGVYLGQLLWDNMRLIILYYRTYLLWYILLTSFISFIVCYRMGPVTNPRSKNIIKWCLQLMSLFVIFYSSHYEEAMVAVIVVLLLGYNIPKTWISKYRTYWKRRFPPKVRLLTNDEYYQEGVKETSRSLQDLRKYCSSPECNQWKTVLKLKDVKRFASFVEGSSHLSDQEIIDYDRTIGQEQLTDDDDSDITDDSNSSN